MEMFYITCNYRQEVLNESISAFIDDLALCTYMHNGKGIATATKLNYFKRNVLLVLFAVFYSNKEERL